MKLTAAMNTELEALRGGWVLQHRSSSSQPWFRTAPQGYTCKVNARTAEALLKEGLISSVDGTRYGLTEKAQRMAAGASNEADAPAEDGPESFYPWR